MYLKNLSHVLFTMSSKTIKIKLSEKVIVVLIACTESIHLLNKFTKEKKSVLTRSDHQRNPAQ